MENAGSPEKETGKLGASASAFPIFQGHVPAVSGNFKRVGPPGNGSGSAGGGAGAATAFSSGGVGGAGGTARGAGFFAHPVENETANDAANNRVGRKRTV
jgi:hypothetical protein